MSTETRKEKIRSMVDAIVDDNQEQAEVDFHGAATDIVKGLIGIPEVPEYETVDSEEEFEVDAEAED